MKHSADVQAQVDAALSLGINVLAYATNRELKTKDSFFPTPTTRQPGDQLNRGQIKRGQPPPSRRLLRHAQAPGESDGFPPAAS